MVYAMHLLQNMIQTLSDTKPLSRGFLQMEDRFSWTACPPHRLSTSRAAVCVHQAGRLWGMGHPRGEYNLDFLQCLQHFQRDN